MEYLLIYYGYSKYYQCVRKHYIEFNSLANLIKYIADANIKKFTIYQKCDIVDLEDVND